MAKIEFNPDDLAPIIGEAVRKTIANLAERALLGQSNGKLAYSEAEAARLLSLKPHQLRDERLEGKILYTSPDVHFAGTVENLDDSLFRVLVERCGDQREAWLWLSSWDLPQEEVQRINAAKSRFLASMSHELRTPLNAVIGFADCMKSEMMGPVQPAQYGEYVDIIHSSGKHLLDLINDVLDLSKIDAGAIALSREEVSIPALLDDCLELISHRASFHFVTLPQRPVAGSDGSFAPGSDRGSLKVALPRLSKALSSQCFRWLFRYTGTRRSPSRRMPAEQYLPIAPSR